MERVRLGSSQRISDRWTSSLSPTLHNPTHIRHTGTGQRSESDRVSEMDGG
jgi:hypothetical protein